MVCLGAAVTRTKQASPTVEHPLLLTDALVVATLDGTKTRTMRPVTSANSLVDGAPNARLFGDLVWDRRVRVGRGLFLDVPHRAGAAWCRVSPRVQPGDTLWVREGWALEDLGDDGELLVWRSDRAAAWLVHWTAGNRKPHYLASDYEPARWRPSIHLAREYARLLLPVTGVGAGRPIDITDRDAAREATGLARIQNAREPTGGPIRDGFWNCYAGIYGEASLTRWAWSYEWCPVAQEGAHA